ncbi:TetR/AcrR family transcriptional regulator [Acrocarpospora macrocephala]|uniref:TetR family transcriptional regulator n=1 Tax=Acrocarpospora macrocephala TaxID=150177 RepID=A0A5M3WDG7_9ACTN|nr:TetR/AcrR family transcriptional regulator [Acrocarpospora macrocephala]GES07125.1 TetR family transcriptional regulator [Acrocarpospora macrocephala]
MATTTRNGHRAGAARLGAGQRRRQLAETAARRFYRYGYHAVALADVAAEVGVTAPAVYRHFRNKNALLAGAIDGALDVVDAAFAAAAESLDDLLFRLAGAALDRRDLWVLLQREMRHLGGAERARVEARFGEFVSRLSARLRQARPDADRGRLKLLVTAVLATMASASVSGVRLPRAEYLRVLAAAAAAAARTELPPAGPRTGPPAAPHRPQVTLSRTEELLETAIALFHERGYAGVSLDDIGAAIGLSGPSIYHHFATKSELLVTAFTQAAHRLAPQRGDTSLDELVRGYIRVGVQQRHLFGVYVTEAINLPQEDGRRIGAELAANVEEWSAALRLRRPDLSVTESHALVYAARGIVNDVVRVGHLHARPHVEAELETFLHAVLNADVTRDATATEQPSEIAG